MNREETARLMAQAVLAGDLDAAWQLADWLLESRGKPPAPPDPSTPLGKTGLSERALVKARHVVARRKARECTEDAERPFAYHKARSKATIADLAACSVHSFRGPKTLPEIRAFLARCGLYLVGDAPVSDRPYAEA